MRPLSGQAPEWLLPAAAAAVAAVTGAVWIVYHAQSGRGQVHTLFQAVALAENAVALLLCRRKPMGALASILVVYLLTDLEWVTGLPVLLALLNLMILGSRRAALTGAAATAMTVFAMPYLHGDHTTLVHVLARAAAIGCAVTAGGYLRVRLRTAGQAAAVDHQQIVPPGSRILVRATDE